ncbi:MAG TPA: dihydrofolate reductase [Candidatus Dormibacteraeota bacterium]|nr:dihydrofolate reductase [Candidatus Dormibacteraeota bacterium]
MSVVLVVAHSLNRVIGNKGQIPWHIPADLRRFKEMTMGHTVVMGRKTYESLPDRFRPLPGRINVVATRNPDYQAEGCIVIHDLPAMLKSASLESAIYVIGGSEIYADSLALATSVELTLVEITCEGDAVFPELDHQWRCTYQGPHQEDNDICFSYVRFERKS